MKGKRQVGPMGIFAYSFLLCSTGSAYAEENLLSSSLLASPPAFAVAQAEKQKEEKKEELKLEERGKPEVIYPPPVGPAFPGLRQRPGAPKVVGSLEEAGDELLTFYRFPGNQRKSLRTTNAD